ncbi:MAG TPA: cytochrome c maturation protein CcmE [Solirubrobacteraceae bacterium]|nr:cytochrome c maturation protein CcmE [Solirubrobacteraceae bacterium]
MRSRQIRLVVSLLVASLLVTVLVYTALAGKTRVLQVHELLGPASAGVSSVRLNGTVVSFRGDPGSSAGMRLVLADNSRQSRQVDVVYHGSVPSAFKAGRAILVDGSLRDGVFVAKKDTLSTKCPSKYQSSTSASGRS